MLVAELHELEEVKGLLVKGQREGVISYGEVAQALAEVEVDEGDIEELYAHLEGHGVEPIEDVVAAEAKRRSPRTSSGAPGAASRPRWT